MNVFLVHGSFGKPFENWFPWIESELSNLGICCNIPTFPTPEHQDYLDWERLMDYYCELGVVNNETVLVGHSCGSVFLVHYLITHAIHVKGLICVSGYNRFISGNELMDGLNQSFYIEQESFSMLPFSDRVISLYGDDDPNIPQEVLRSFAIAIGGEVQCIPIAGHFNASAGFLTCPVVLDAIKQCI